jgi:small subunit ribosomal protein S8
MQITDSIADMLTRIRNASTAGHATVEVPASNLKKAIARILQDEGYIGRIELIANEHQGVIRISLKYAAKKSVISGIKRISRPGLRVYADSEKLPKVLGGLGIAIISTSQGIMTDRKARLAGIGGEVLAFVW